MQQTLQLIKFEGVNFKYDNGFFEFQPGNIQINIFCCECKYLLFLHETSHIEKFEGTDFENGNGLFFKFSQKYSHRNFL